MSITTLFLDIGGVILTNGWDHLSREKAAKTFKFNFAEMEERHKLIFDSYESGNITLNEYLRQVIFYQKRSFTPKQFREFMFTQSQPFPEMIELIRRLKSQYHLKIVVLSNEAYELNAYRIKTFKLHQFVDFFISSCYVHLRKPDPDMYRMALNISQTSRRQIIYIEDRPLYITFAQNLGIKGIVHTGVESTRKQLAQAGLKL
jgi:putative hydrolase of the HAD superfamily